MNNSEIIHTKYSKELIFSQTKIFHYEASPIDDYQGYGLCLLTDLKDEIINILNTCKGYFNSYGGEFWENMAHWLLKRSLVEQWNGEFRDSYIWFYIQKGMVMTTAMEPTDIYDIENIFLVLKEDNNGTCHLFSFFPLPDATPLDEIEYGMRFVIFPNNIKDEWYYHITNDEVKKLLEQEKQEKINMQKNFAELRETMKSYKTLKG